MKLVSLKNSMLIRQLIVIATVVSLLFAPGFSVVAQNTESEEEEQIRAQYEQELEQLRKEEAEARRDLEKQKQQSNSISGEIEALENQINQAEQAISVRENAIQSLSGSIQQSNQRLKNLSGRITQAQGSLAELMRESDKKDGFSIVEVVMSSESISDFFEDIETFESFRDDIQQKLTLIKEARIETKSQREQLQEERLSEEELKQVQVLQRQEVAQQEDQKQQLLTQSKTQESFQENVIEQKQKEAAQIRAKLFALRDANVDINFGQALDIARDVEAYTGIRPAFLLAILTQETNIGKNVGTCNLPSSPPSQKWDQIMKPSRDIEPYKRITSGLGITPDTKPLSCPQSVGWGGAMGPAQFIPSTWESLLPQISQATGANPPNPWNPQHAFFASGVFLSNLGAGAGTQAAEIEAAGRYFAGGNWRQNGMYYANSVQRIANDIQRTKIDPLTN